MASVVYSSYFSTVLQHVPLCRLGPICAYRWEVSSKQYLQQQSAFDLHLMQVPCTWPCRADQKQTTWLGQSYFGSQWRRLIEFNQVFSAACLNGGLLGTFNTPTIMCCARSLHVTYVPCPGTVIAYVRLKEHRTAKQVNTVL